MGVRNPDALFWRERGPKKKCIPFSEIFFLFPSSTRGRKIQRFFESHARYPNKVWAGGGRGYPPATCTIPLAPADFLYHGWGTPPALFLKNVPSFFLGSIFFSGLQPENKWDPKIPQKGRFLA